MVLLAVFMFAACGSDSDPGGEVTLSVSPTSANKVVGESFKITATVKPAGTEITWTSSDTAIATVTDGTVKTVAAGNATITATAGGKTAACTVTVTQITEDSRDYVLEEDGTLVHYKPNLVGVSHFGNDLGTTNGDGSYTFDNTADPWEGGGAQYSFPADGGDWKISDYNVVEIFLTVTSGSVNVGLKQAGNNTDLPQFPTPKNTTLNSSTDSFKFRIADTRGAIGFQRSSGGPATVAITKAVFSKVAEYTVQFADYKGEGVNVTWDLYDIKVLSGGFLKAAELVRLRKSGYTFYGWFDGDTKYTTATPITKDVTLKPKWTEGDAAEVDMTLDLNPDNWGTLPPNTQNNTVGNITWPNDYAAKDYDADSKKLTIHFAGKNRERFVIPLSDKQLAGMEEYISTPGAGGITFDFDVESVKVQSTGVTADTGVYKYRYHLGDPSLSSSYNGTNTQESPNQFEDTHVTFNSTNSADKYRKTLIIQAMYFSNGSPDNPDSTGKWVPVDAVIKSIKIVFDPLTQ